MRILIAVSCLAVAASVGLGTDLFGRSDTIGGTTYDWQFTGPVARRIANAPAYGVHVAWMYSADSAPWSDRNMRYNFYDYATHAWNWTDADYMQSGLNVFAERAGYGSLDADPTSGVAVISGHCGDTLHAVLARDVAPGAGIFEFASGQGVADGCQRPCVAVGQNSTAHVSAAGDGVCYSRVMYWPSWDSVVQLDSVSTGCHNITASKVSNKVAVTWVDLSVVPCTFWCDRSTDGGETWNGAEQIGLPPAFGGDTSATFTVQGAFPWYDASDRLHIVAPVTPIVHDTFYGTPAAIWHWCEENSPAWSRVQQAGCDPAHLAGELGYNACFCGRPSIGEDNDGRLYVAWEQFDSANVEPATGMLRAGIWMAGSVDNGVSWGAQSEYATPGTASCRFPCIIDEAIDGGMNDTVMVVYLCDQQAGFSVEGQGWATNNPIVVGADPRYPGVSEGRGGADVAALRVWPNPCADVLNMTASCVMRDASCVLMDAAGRKVFVLHDGANDVSGLAAGVYFTLEPSAVHKVVISR
jgi:hypothetical protein